LKSLVGKLRERRGLPQGDERLRPDETPLSTNRVTGFSVNLPIWPTCRPTPVCARTCYYATGTTSWPASIRKQWRVLGSISEDPAAFAERVAAEIRRHRLTFLRWNGGGDLFAESSAALSEVARLCPEVAIWVVTRKPEEVAGVADLPNVFIQFSLDRSSRARRAEVERLGGHPRLFYSYQCDRDEIPDPVDLRGVAVVYADGYRPPEGWALPDPETSCPLNVTEEMDGACARCRRCFDGSALARQGADGVS
jgi:hypothetical protein